MSAIALLIPGQMTAGSATGEAKPAGGVPGAQAQGMGALFQLLLNGSATAGQAVPQGMTALPVTTEGSPPVPRTIPAGLLPEAMPQGAATPEIPGLPGQPADAITLPANLLAFAAPQVQESAQTAIAATPQPAAPVPTSPAVDAAPVLATPQPAVPRQAVAPATPTANAAVDAPEAPAEVTVLATKPAKGTSLAPAASDDSATSNGPAPEAGAQPSPDAPAQLIALPMPVALQPVDTPAQPVLAAGVQPVAARQAQPQAAAPAGDEDAADATPEGGGSKPVNSTFADALGKTAQPQRLEMPGAVSAPTTVSTGNTGSEATSAPATRTADSQAETKASASSQPAADRPVDVAAANATHALSHPTMEKVQAAQQHTANDNSNAVRETPAGQVSVQLAHAVRTGESRIDVALTPAELGRVEIRLEISRDGSASAHIVAERADTLDLLKRDASTLERVLQDSGLRADSSSLSFNLRGEGQRNQNQQNGPFASAPYAQPVVADEDQPVIQRRYAWQSDSGLDISV
jgi:flagellar hook-length control protein FliK